MQPLAADGAVAPIGASRPRLAMLPSWLVAAGLVAWALCVRLPFAFAPRSDADAALFWIIGHGWRDGLVPYATLWDVKPPAIFAIFAAADALFGADPVGPRILAAIAVGLGACGLYRIGARHLGSRRTGLFAALLLPPYTLLLDGLAMKPELFAAPLLIWGIGLVAEPRARPRAIVLAGTLLGAAAMLKQTAAFEILFTLAFLAATRRDWRPCAALAGGLVVVPLGFLLYFGAVGAADDLLGASVIGALARLHGDGATLAGAPVRLLGLLKPALPLIALAALGWTERKRLAWPQTGHAALLVWGWLGTAVAGELAMRAMYPAYALPLLGPLALAAARPLAALADAPRPALRAAGLGAAVLAALWPVAYRLAAPDPDIDPQPGRVAAYVRAQVPGRPVFVVNYDPAVYQLSGAPVPSRFPFPQHLVCDFPALPVPVEAELRRILASRPAALVFAPESRRMYCEIPARVALVRSLAVTAGYRPAAAIPGAAGPAQVWLAPATSR